MHSYHAIVDHPDGSQPSQRVSLEAEDIDQAKDLFAAKYGKEMIFRVWMDYKENKFLGYSE